MSWHTRIRLIFRRIGPSRNRVWRLNSLVPATSRGNFVDLEVIFFGFYTKISYCARQQVF